jgi:hypothetical protein
MRSIMYDADKRVIDILLDLLIDVENGKVQITHWDMDQVTMNTPSYNDYTREIFAPLINQTLRLHITRRIE